MITLLLIIFIILFCVSMYIFVKNSPDDFWGTLTIIFASITLILAIFEAFTIDSVVNSRYIDDRIAVYQEENTNIEKDIVAIVKQYQEHEAEVFNMSEISSSVTLVQMYPELKSNDMVLKQIEIFNENNKKIKTLKSKKIDYEKARFMLYFGG